MNENNQAPQSNNKIGVFVVIALLVALGAFMLFSRNQSTTEETDLMMDPQGTEESVDTTMDSTPEPTQPVNNNKAPEKLPMGTVPSGTEVRTIEVEAGAFYYKPNVITVKKGETVKIVLKSVDMMHDFKIDALNVALPVVTSGNMGTVEFTANQVGEFEYYCSVGQHRANGQVGKLIVQ